MGEGFYVNELANNCDRNNLKITGRIAKTSVIEFFELCRKIMASRERKREVIEETM